MPDTQPPPNESDSPVEASARLTKYGRNLIESGEQKTFLKRLADVLINPFNLVLFVVLAGLGYLIVHLAGGAVQTQVYPFLNDAP